MSVTRGGEDPGRAKAGRDPDRVRGARGGDPSWGEGREGNPTQEISEWEGSGGRGRGVKVEVVTPILVTLACPPGMASRGLVRGCRQCD